MVEGGCATSLSLIGPGFVTQTLSKHVRTVCGMLYKGNRRARQPLHVFGCRGCITVMEKGGYAASGVKHCVRPVDMTGDLSCAYTDCPQHRCCITFGHGLCNHAGCFQTATKIQAMV